MAKYVLNDSIKPIFASTYQLYLPSDTELETELKKEIEEIKYKLEQKKPRTKKWYNILVQNNSRFYEPIR